LSTRARGNRVWIPTWYARGAKGIRVQSLGYVAKGAQGLMQLMPSVQQQFGVTDPYDPKQNVSAGTRLLKQLLGQFGGDVPLALGAYNAGAGRVEQYGGVPPFPETVGYVSGILSDMGKK
jgi:Predicted soluble lytic transglycosylase fused to an ABC-type amino acid-binding protein